MAAKRTPIVGRLYHAAGPDREIDVKPGMATPKANELLWIDTDRSADALRAIDDALGWDGVMARLEDASARPRVVIGRDVVRITVTGLKKGTDAPHPQAVDLITATNVVVSVHEAELEGLGLPLEVVAGETEFGALDESAFVAVLLDGILNGYFHAVEQIERRIDEYDERALRARLDDDLVSDLVGLRRRVAVLRRALNPQREVFYTLERPGLVLGDSEGAAWPQIADRFRQAVEAIENARELLVGTFDIVISRSGERTNDVMRVLTVVSSVLLPSVVIAGIMGMNFKPGFFDDPQNFVLVVVAMIALAVGILLFARFKHWI